MKNDLTSKRLSSVENQSKRYCVVIGDLVASKKMMNRDQVQKDLLWVVERVNRRFKPNMVAPFEITRGDEIAAVFFKASPVNRAINIFFDTYPSEIRFGVAFGILSTSLDLLKTSSEIDGPGFYEADEALEEVRRAKRWVSFRLGDSFFDRTLTTLKNLIMTLQHSWTPRQREICRLYKEMGNQTKVAEKLNISQQAVAKSLRISLWDEYVEGEKTIEWLLQQFDRLKNTGFKYNSFEL